MTIFPIDAATNFISGITTALSDNILPILAILAFLVGISIIMAMIDIRNENKWLENYGKRWK